MIIGEKDPWYKRLGLHLLILAGYSGIIILVYYLYPHFFESESGQALHYARLWISRGILLAMFLHFVAVLLLDRKWIVGAWVEYWNEPGTSRNLAMFRILFMFILTFHTLYEPLSSFLSRAGLPVSARVALPYMGWLIHHIPISSELYIASVVIAVIFGIMSTLGIFTRWSLLGYTLMALYIFGVPNFFGKLNHNHILVWFPFLLALGPSGDDLSVDAFLRRMQGVKVSTLPHRKYSLPLRFIWMQLGIIYFFAGSWKLLAVGLDWCLSDNLVNIMRWEWVENYDQVPAIRIDKAPWLVRLAGLGVIFLEMLFIVLILKPRTRIFAFLAGLGFHESNGYFLKIRFANLQQSYLSMLDWKKGVNWFQGIQSKWLKVGVLVLLILAMMYLFYLPGARLFGGIVLFLLVFPKAKLRIKWWLRRRVARWKQNRNFTTPAQPQPAFNLKPLLMGGALLLSINAIHGVFDINSWPFSAYPAYVDYLPDYMEMLYFEARDEAGNPILYMDSAEKQKYHRENYMRLEPGIIQYYHTGDSLALDHELRHYLDLWKSDFPELEDAVYIGVWLDAFPLNPEERENRIRHEKIHEWTLVDGSTKKE